MNRKDWKTNPDWSYEESTVYYDDPISFEPVELLCGNIAEFDQASGISYRCTTCLAVVGSIGMPRECKALYDMEEVVKKLKGKK